MTALTDETARPPLRVPPHLIDAAGLRTLLAISDGRCAALVLARDFPPVAAQTSRGSLWELDAVQEWLDQPSDRSHSDSPSCPVDTQLPPR